MSMPPPFSAAPDDDGIPAADPDVVPAAEPRPEEADQADLPQDPPFRTPDPRRIGPDDA